MLINDCCLGEDFFRPLPIWDDLNASLYGAWFFEVVGVDHRYKVGAAVGVVYELAGDVAGVSLVGLTTAAGGGRIVVCFLFVQLARSSYFKAWNYLLVIILSWLPLLVKLLLHFSWTLSVGTSLIRVRRLIVIHIGHKYLLGVLLVYEDIGFDELNAPIVEGNLYFEVVTKVLQEFFAVDVRIEGVGSAREDQDWTEEVDHHCVHNGIAGNGLLDRNVALTENSKELHNEVLELQVAEDGGVIIFEEDELEALIIKDGLYLIDVPLVVDAFQFKAQLQVLIVEHSYVGLRIIVEPLHDSSRVY